MEISHWIVKVPPHVVPVVGPQSHPLHMYAVATLLSSAIQVCKNASVAGVMVGNG